MIIRWVGALLDWVIRRSDPAAGCDGEDCADLAASAAAEARGGFADWAAECPHLRLLADLLPPREGW